MCRVMLPCVIQRQGSGEESWLLVHEVPSEAPHVHTWYYFVRVATTVDVDYPMFNFWGATLEVL